MKTFEITLTFDGEALAGDYHDGADVEVRSGITSVADVHAAVESALEAAMSEEYAGKGLSGEIRNPDGKTLLCGTCGKVLESGGTHRVCLECGTILCEECAAKGGPAHGCGQ